MSYGISQSYLPPDRGSDSRPYPGRIGRYSIYPPIKDERLSRPDMQSTLTNDLENIWTLIIYRARWIVKNGTASLNQLHGPVCRKAAVMITMMMTRTTMMMMLIYITCAIVVIFFSFVFVLIFAVLFIQCFLSYYDT